MSDNAVHRETVKAAIRIEYGSIAAFAGRVGLKPQQVRDTLRGTSSSAKHAVAKLLGVDAAHLRIVRDSTTVEGDNKADATPHRLIAAER